MRIAATDPFARYCTVTLDGEHLRYCLEADEEEGWARCEATGPDGRPVFTPAYEQEPYTEILRGEVRVEFDPPEWRAVVEAANALAKVAPHIEIVAKTKVSR